MFNPIKKVEVKVGMAILLVLCLLTVQDVVEPKRSQQGRGLFVHGGVDTKDQQCKMKPRYSERILPFVFKSTAP